MIYVASSWRNTAFESVLDCLDQWSLSYYNFKDSEGFHWSEVMPGYKDEGGCSSQRFIHALTHRAAIRGFLRDWDAMNVASSLLLVLPCGRSAHMELGWACGRKPTCVFFPQSYRTTIEPELMYKMADFVTDDIDRCMQFMADAEPDRS